MAQKIFVKFHNQIKTENTNFIYHLLNSHLSKKFKHFLKFCIVIFILLGADILYSQETYNLEVIFKRTAWDLYPNLYDYGISLASGDVNSDGFSDIAVGASHWVDTLAWWALDIYVFFGSSVMDTFYDAVLHCPPHFGHNESALWIGDINGDSIGDVVVGDLGAGDVRVFFGAVSFDTLVDLIIHNVGVFGCSVSGGDINGDGFNDLVVGSYVNGGNLDGRIYVYYGGPLLDAFPDVIINGHNGEAFGKSVGSGGDVNSDGFEDIVVGADENSEAYPGAGKVYVFFGGNPMDTIPDCWLHGEGPTHYLGWQPVSIVNNNLTFDRVLFGTPFYPYGFPSYAPGKLYVLFGGSPMDSLVDWFKHGENDSSSLGMASSSGGFESGDMFGEFVGGAPIGVTRYGKASVWLGDSPLDSIEDANIKGVTPIEIGWVVACAGDVNGDGYDEVMFSNYAADSNQTVWVCKYTGEGIAEVRSEKLKTRMVVYPNPFRTDIRLQMSDHGYKSIRIYDISGREVFWKRRDKETWRHGEMVEIDTRDLPCGVYFVQVEADSESIIRKVVKIK